MIKGCFPSDATSCYFLIMEGNVGKLSEGLSILRSCSYEIQGDLHSGGNVMAEVDSKDTSIDSLLFVGLYCKNFREDTSFWDQVFEYFLSSSESEEDGLLDLECGSEGEGEEFKPTQQKVVSGSDINWLTTENCLTSTFYIVSNRGCLYGDYDCKQRF